MVVERLMVVEQVVEQVLVLVLVTVTVHHYRYVFDIRTTTRRTGSASLPRY
jgi:cytochrome c oxidase subunit IV